MQTVTKKTLGGYSNAKVHAHNYCAFSSWFLTVALTTLQVSSEPSTVLRVYMKHLILPSHVSGKVSTEHLLALFYRRV
jgi:hypothetical protein